VDEVEADGATVHQGTVWSFTIEPEGYPIQTVTATATSSNNKDMGPEKTVNRSGLNADDQHSTDGKAMWLSKRNGADWISMRSTKP
jgi:hypothetical protein